MRKFSQNSTTEKVASKVSTNELSFVKSIFIFVMGILLFLFASTEMSGQETCWAIEQYGGTNPGYSMSSWNTNGGSPTLIGGDNQTEVETMTMNGSCGDIYIVNNGDLGKADHDK